MPSNRRTRRALWFAVVICVCTGIAVGPGTVTATAAGPEAAGALEPDSGHADTDIGCSSGVGPVEFEAVGDVVDVEMLLCFEGSVTIEGPGYQGVVNLSSGDGSGRVTLHLNTHLNDSDAIGVTSDTLDVETNAVANGSFRSGNYLLTVRDGSGDVVDEKRFEMEESGAEDLRLWRAPRGAASELRTVESIISSKRTATQYDSRRDVENPDTSDTLYLATNETLVVAIHAHGLEGAMAAAEGSALARFRTALRETGSRLLVEQAQESVPPEREAITPDVLNSSATHLVAQSQNDTYYLVIDTSRLYADRSTSSEESVRLGSSPGSKFVYRFTMERGDLETLQPSALHSADYRMVLPSFRFPRVRGDVVVLPPEAGQRIRVRTILAPGSEVTVNVSGGVNRTVTRIVGGGTDSVFQGFTVPLDLSDVPNGTNVTLQFEDRGSERTKADELRGVVRRPEASLQVRDDPLTSQSLVLRSLHVSHPSIVAVYTGDGSLVGTQPVESGLTEGVFVPLTLRNSEPSTYRVVLYRDADRSRSLTAADERYRVGGLPVSSTVDADAGDVEAASETAPDTSTATTPGTTVTTTGEPIDTAASETRTTADSTPGFGVVAAVLALAASLLLANRDLF